MPIVFWTTVQSIGQSIADDVNDDHCRFIYASSNVRALIIRNCDLVNYK